jgi:cytochrome oxidase Cu insertion factor (SCO1/SenC/PrrC family)
MNMRRVTVVGLAILAALAISALGVASASAAQPKYLPGSGTLTFASGAAKLQTVSGSTVKCTSDEGTGTIESETKGTFDLLFLGCESEGFIKAKCTGLSDTTTGSVLVTGSFRPGRITAGGTVVEVSTINAVHFSCSIVLVVVTGSLACPVTPTNKKVKTTEHYTVKCEVAGGGVAKITSVENAAETGTEAVGLKTATNEGTAEGSSEETTETVTPSVESEIMA